MAPKILVACGGGGLRGAVQVGMIAALLERGIAVDAWTGVSTGAIQAGFMAQAPAVLTSQATQVAQLEKLWRGLTRAPVGGGLLGAIWRVVTGKPSIHTSGPLVNLLARGIMTPPVTPVELGAVSLNLGNYVGHRPQTVADLRQAVLSSASVPGEFPPVGAEADADGGLSHVAPLGPAFNLANDLWPTTEPVIIVLLHCLPLDGRKLPPQVGPTTGMGNAALWKLLPRAVDILETNNERRDLTAARQYNDLVKAYAGRTDGPSWLAGKRYAPILQIAPTMDPGFGTLEFDHTKLLAYLAHGKERAAAVLAAGWPPT